MKNTIPAAVSNQAVNLIFPSDFITQPGGMNAAGFICIARVAPFAARLQGPPEQRSCLQRRYPMEQDGAGRDRRPPPAAQNSPV
jgi:hypothetical protein